MVIVQGTRRRNLATTTFSTSSVVAFILVLFLGLFLSLTESSPAGGRSPDGGAGIFDPKRSGSKGFHEGIFDDGFGGFSTLRKRSGSKGFHEGIFDDGFGGFSTLRKRNMRNMAVKRRPEMDSRGIDGDAFTGGFGDFYTMKRSQQHRPDVFLESLLEGYEGLLNRVSALERKEMDN